MDTRGAATSTLLDDLDKLRYTAQGSPIRGAMTISAAAAGGSEHSGSRLQVESVGSDSILGQSNTGSLQPQPTRQSMPDRVRLVGQARGRPTRVMTACAYAVLGPPAAWTKICRN